MDSGQNRNISGIKLEECTRLEQLLLGFGLGADVTPNVLSKALDSFGPGPRKGSHN